VWVRLHPNIPANFPSAMHTSIVLHFLFVNDTLKWWNLEWLISIRYIAWIQGSASMLKELFSGARKIILSRNFWAAQKIISKGINTPQKVEFTWMEVDAVFDILVWYRRHQSHMDRTNTYPWTMSVPELLEHRSLSHYCSIHLNRRTFSQRSLCISFLMKSQELQWRQKDAF